VEKVGATMGEWNKAIHERQRRHGMKKGKRG